MFTQRPRPEMWGQILLQHHTEYLLFSYLLLQNPSQISFKVKTLGDRGLNDHDQQCN